MTDTSDLVARLRHHSREYPQWDYGPVGGAMRKAAETIERLTRERDEARTLEAEAAKHVETVICMRTNFTGEPPYVGWRGLGLALTEKLDADQARIAKLEKALSAAHYYIDASDGELSDAGMTRKDALRAARIAREALEDRT
jgi:hypothetical protein